MSSDSGQAVRAGIRKGSGNGRAAGPALLTTNHPTIPSLAPQNNDVIKLLQSQKITKKDDKYDAFKAVFLQKEALSAHLNALFVENLKAFDDIVLGTRLRSIASYHGETSGATCR